MAIKEVDFFTTKSGAEIPFANPQACGVGRTVRLPIGARTTDLDYFEIISGDEIALVDENDQRRKVLTGNEINESPLFTISSGTGRKSIIFWKPYES